MPKKRDLDQEQRQAEAEYRDCLHQQLALAERMHKVLDRMVRIAFEREQDLIARLRSGAEIEQGGRYVPTIVRQRVHGKVVERLCLIDTNTGKPIAPKLPPLPKDLIKSRGKLVRFKPKERE